MVVGFPLIVTLLPTTLAFAPKRRCHNPKLRTAIGSRPACASSGCRVRPRNSGVRNNVEEFSSHGRAMHALCLVAIM